MINSTASLEAATDKPVGFASPVVLEPSGIIPRDGKPEILWACSGVRTVLSTPSSRNARPIPLVSPRAKANPRFRGTLGSAGDPGVRAISTGRILLERRPAVTPASFNFWSRPSYRVRLVSKSRLSRLYSMALSFSLFSCCFCSSSVERWTRAPSSGFTR